MLLALYLNGTVLPPFGLEGLWFYSALAALIVGEFLVEPFFTKPADAMANSIALVIGCASASLAGAEIDGDVARTGRLVFVICGLVLIGMTSLAIAFNDHQGWIGGLAEQCRKFITTAGRARVLFSALLFAAGYAAFADDAGKVAALYLAWFLIAVVAPFEGAIAWLAGRHKTVRSTNPGRLERVEDPGIVVARLPRGAHPRIGDVATVGDGRQGVVVDITTLFPEPRVRIALDSPAPASVGTSVVLGESGTGAPAAGFVGERTTLTELRMRTAASASELGLEEGRLLEARVGERPVLFQITEASVVGEVTTDGSRDVVEVTARKLGTWNDQTGAFEGSGWLPAPGTSVRLFAETAQTFNAQEIGHVPGTTYGVRVDVDRAVTQNTAVLGVLGVGKSHLAWELIQRMLDDGIKVIALDITGQYSAHFSEICSPETARALTERLDADIAPNLENANVRGTQAGNIEDFEQAIDRLLADFVTGDERLLILDPSRFAVSRMEGKPFSGRANFMSRLTIVQITHIITETVLRLVTHTFSTRARVCLVYEEAHSLIPEWNSAVNDGDSSAANGTARAILQGRKYGLGCVVVTGVQLM
jgi:uncharacterized protein